MVVISPDGTFLHDFRSVLGGFTRSHAWMPDGSQIVYAGSATQVLARNHDGGGTDTLLFDAATLGEDAVVITDVSPDGSRVLVSLAVRSIWSIWTIDSTGRGDPRPVVDGTSPSDMALFGYFSPDGTEIVFTRRANNVDAMAIIGADRTGERPVPTGVSPSYARDWGRDNRIYFMGPYPHQIYSISPHGTERIQHTNDGFSNLEPDLSP